MNSVLESVALEAEAIVPGAPAREPVRWNGRTWTAHRLTHSDQPAILSHRMEITLKDVAGTVYDAEITAYGGTLHQPKDVLMVALPKRIPSGSYTAIVGGDLYEVALSYSPHGGDEHALAFLDGCDIQAFLKSAGH